MQPDDQVPLQATAQEPVGAVMTATDSVAQPEVSYYPQHPTQPEEVTTAVVQQTPPNTAQVIDTPPASILAEPSLPQTETSALTDDIYVEICKQIILEQQEIIGSLALNQANSVEGLVISSNNGELVCKIQQNGPQVIDSLISKYHDFFGYAAVAVCKEAAAQLLVKLPKTEIPSLLR